RMTATAHEYDSTVLGWKAVKPLYFHDTATAEIYTLSLHDALPISSRRGAGATPRDTGSLSPRSGRWGGGPNSPGVSYFYRDPNRSEEHTSELQSPYDLVCRLLLEKKKIIRSTSHLRVTNVRASSAR